jgi:ABC-type transport system involved in multi-copper enzyme maturation permease subunit
VPFGHVLQAEWTKIKSVRATFFSLLVAAVLAIGIGALVSQVSANHYLTDFGVRDRWDPTSRSLSGLALAQLAIAVLGVMMMSSEYSSGMIRTTFTAVPQRARVLAAKAVVFTGVVLIVGEVLSFVAFFVGQSIISSHSGVPYASLGQTHVLRAVIGGGLYIAALGLLGIALGAILRHAAAAIAVIVAVIYVLPGVANALPTNWQHSVEKYWPTQAGSQVVVVVRDAHTLSAWPGFIDMCVFVAIVLAVAFTLLVRRDA